MNPICRALFQPHDHLCQQYSFQSKLTQASLSIKHDKQQNRYYENGDDEDLNLSK